MKGKHAKIISLAVVGLILFSASMVFLLDFELEEKAKEKSSQFIKVKDGYFSYLDKRGYNFQFACEINQILIVESKQVISDKQIIIESNNSFGYTKFIFDKLPDGDVKFSVNHQGNFQRNYWFRMILVNNGLKLYKLAPIFIWESGSFDFSDIQEDESFWMDQNLETKDIFLSLKFDEAVDFYVDPLLSETILLDPSVVDTYDDFNVDGLSNLESLYYDTSNTTGWTQYYSQSDFSTYNSSFLQNGDFDSLINSTIYDSSIDDDYGAWYSTNGNPSVIRHNETLITNQSENRVVHYPLNDGWNDTDGILNNGGFESGSTWNAAYWTEVSNAQRSQATFTSYEGSWHMLFFASGARDLVYQNINFDSNNFVNLTYYWISNSGTHTIYGSKCVIYYSDTTNTTNTFGTTSGVWTQRAVTSVDADKTITRIEIGIRQESDGGAQAAVDAVVLNLKPYTAEDISGNDLNGTWTNHPKTNSSFNTDANYSVQIIAGGDNEYINCTDQSVFSFGNGTVDSPFTIHAWVYVDSASADVIFVHKYGDASPNYEWILMGRYSGGSIYPQLKLAKNTSSTDYIAVEVNNALSLDTWYNLIGRYDGSGNQSGLTLFLDGKQYLQNRTANGNYVAMSDTDQVMEIGKSTVSQSIRVDEVILYNVSVPNDYIYLNYRDSPNGFPNYWNYDDNLKVRYEFDEGSGSGSIIEDLSGNGHTGYLSHSDAWDTPSYNAEADYCLNRTDDFYVAIDDTGIHPDFIYSDGITDSPFSLSIWFNVDVSGGIHYHILASKWRNIAIPQYPAEWILDISNQDRLRFRLSQNGTGEQGDWIGIQYLTVLSDTWYHCHINYDGSASSSGIDMYLNGTLASVSNYNDGTYTAGWNGTNYYNDTWKAVVRVANTDPLSTAQRTAVDSFAYWNTNLTAERILWNFQNSPKYLGFESPDGGVFGDNSQSLALEPTESVAQDIWLNSTNIQDIKFDTKQAGIEGDDTSLRVNLYYSDGSNTTQDFQHNTTNIWYTELRKDEFTNITSGKIVTKIEFESRNNVSNLYLDNVVINYTSDLNFHQEDEFKWMPTGLSNWNYGGAISERHLFFFHKRLVGGDLPAIGIFTNNSYLGLDVNDTWEITLNLTFNPFSEWYGDYSFAGGIQFHFLDSNNDSLAYVDLIDNSTDNETHQVGGSLFYNTSASGGEFAKAYEFDSTNYNITNGLLKIKKAGSGIHIYFPNGTSFGGNYTLMEDISTIFQEGNPVGIGIQFHRFNGSRSIDLPNRNDSIKSYYSNGADYSENFTDATFPDYSRYVLDTPMFISSLNVTSWEMNVNTTISNVTGSWYGYLVNGSNQVFYELNYTISEPSGSIDWLYHNHTFIIPHNYTFVNVTFGNGVTRTIIKDFDLTSINSTHDRIVFEDIVNGTFNWFFLTGNSIVYFDINPQWQVNGTVVNQSLISYNIQVANGSNGIANYPVNISVMWSDETVIFTEQKLTGLNGWLNSSFDQALEMRSDHEFWIRAVGVNQSFLGFAVDYYLSYNDWTAPIINNVEFEERVDKNVPLQIKVYLTEDWTPLADLVVRMNYGFISSGQLDQIAYLTYQDGKHIIEVAGQAAETTIWFEFIIWDNLSNSLTSSVFSAEWIEPAAEEGPAAGDGDGAPAPAITPAPAGDNIMFIMIFLAGGIMVAVLGYAVFRQVAIRERRVETREVVTGFGRVGQTREQIVERGTPPKKKPKKPKKKK